MRPLLALVAAAATLLPGCLGGLGHCGPTATWEGVAPGAYDALVARGGEPERWDPSSPLALAAPDLDAAWPRQALTGLHHVSASSGRDGMRATLEANDPLELHLTVPAEAPEAEVAGYARRVLADLTAAPEDEREAVVRALLAAREAVAYGMGGDVGSPTPEMRVLAYGHRAPLDLPLRLDEAWRDAGGLAAAAPQGEPGVGRVALQLGGWTWHFRLPTVEARLDVTGGEVYARADTLDTLSLHRAAGGQTEVATSFEAALRELRLDARVEPGSIRTVVC